MSYLDTIKTLSQVQRFEEFVRSETARNIRENNPKYLDKERRGMLMYGMDESGKPYSGIRKKQRYEL